MSVQKPPPVPIDVIPGLSVTVVDATLTVRSAGTSRSLLNRMTVPIAAGEFVAVIGASGSGKSTLIRAISGCAKLTTGEIRVAGVVRSSEELAVVRRIAYLPQDVVVHTALTPFAALTYAARLRGTASHASSLTESVHHALTRVGLADRGNVPIHRLSGGQQKRVALAMELLGDPGLILLDEPTSGLDPATEAEMMALFRSLADEGRTVICVTHTPSRLQWCDRLIVMAEGYCVFHGPPALAASFFGVRKFDELYAAIGQQPIEVWQDRLQQLRESALPPAVPIADVKPDEPVAVPNPQEQLGILLGRLVRLQFSDLRAWFLQLVQAPAIGLMIGTTFGDIRSRFAEQHAADARQVLFVLVVAVLWCAGASSVREVVKERTLIRHERRYGLNLGSYLASKLVVVGGWSIVQTAILLAIVRAMVHPPGPLDVQFAVLSLTAIAGVCLGLWLSTLAETSEQAMTLLPVALIGLAVFSGGLARLSGASLWIATIGSPAYWSMDGLKAPLVASLRAATYPGAPGTYQPPILGSGGPLVWDLVALSVQSIVLLVLAFHCLRKRVAAN